MLISERTFLHNIICRQFYIYIVMLLFSLVEAIADLLNSHFSSVFTVENISSIPNPISNFDFTNSQIFSDISVDENLVYEKLSKMNISKSQGPDELNPKLIFELRKELCKPLTYLFNM